MPGATQPRRLRHRPRSPDRRRQAALLGVRDILKTSVEATKALLKRELEIKLGELEQQWHWDSLERIFIEERIYRLIEKSKTWESVLAEIRGGLKPFLQQLRREVTEEDIVRLTEIRIKRISAYNRFQADEAMKKIEQGMRETKGHLKNLTGYAVAWFEMLQEKYGKGLKRRTSYDEIQQIDASAVVSATSGSTSTARTASSASTGGSTNSSPSAPSSTASLTIMKDGSLKVSKVADKVFMGRKIIHVSIWPKDGDMNFYTMSIRMAKRAKPSPKIPNRRTLSRQALPLGEIRKSRIIYLQISAGRRYAQVPQGLSRWPQRGPRPRDRFRSHTRAGQHTHRQGTHRQQVADQGSESHGVIVSKSDTAKSSPARD
ncbi:MAG: hypothetical protein WDN28_20700 [Chthoniobacter sp.]